VHFECSGVVHPPVIVVFERSLPVVQIEFEAHSKFSKGPKLGAGNTCTLQVKAVVSSYPRVQANRLFHAAATQGNEDAKRFTGRGQVEPVSSKVMLPFKFLASLYFALVFLKAGQSYRSRAQIGAAVTKR
jgi:hypothetical protein